MEKAFLKSFSFPNLVIVSVLIYFIAKNPGSHQKINNFSHLLNKFQINLPKIWDYPKRLIYPLIESHCCRSRYHYVLPFWCFVALRIRHFNSEIIFWWRIVEELIQIVLFLRLITARKNFIPFNSFFLSKDTKDTYNLFNNFRFLLKMEDSKVILMGSPVLEPCLKIHNFFNFFFWCL